MDLLATIIERKRNNRQDLMTTVQNLLTDIIKYEKLAKADKFRDLRNPIVQKQCPHLVKILDTTTYEYVISLDLLPLLVDFTGRNIGTLELLEQTRIEKALNDIYEFDVHISEISRLAEPPQEYIALKETVDGLVKYMILTQVETMLYIYVGQIDNDTVVAVQTTANPIMMDHGDDRILISSFSSMGNNDYRFGHINGNPIRIRDSKLLVGGEEIQLDENKLSLLDDVKDVAEYLLTTYIQYKGDKSCK